MGSFSLRAVRARLAVGGLLGSGGLLLAGMTIVNAGNYLFNLVLGRWLGPADFADLSLIITLFLVVTFVTSALQTTAARFAAADAAEGGARRTAAIRRWLGRWAWGAGGAALVIFVLGAPLWSAFFHSASPWPFVIFGLSVPLYFVQGVDRGVLQGRTRFGPFAASFQIEMWVRLALGCGLVALGLGVGGATGALAISIAAAWLYARWAAARELPAAAEPLPAEERAAIGRYALPVVLGLLGQILINNSDILIVKRFFSAAEAGGYAALALIGRIVFFATWSIVTALFPIVAQRHQRGEPHRHLLAAGLALVGVASGAILVATLVAPELIVELLFDRAYLAIAPLLWMYAAATALYALANVVISYRLSIGEGFGSTLALAAGVAQIVALLALHDSLEQVVVVQMAVMGGLLVALLVWDLALWLRRRA